MNVTALSELNRVAVFKLALDRGGRLFQASMISVVSIKRRIEPRKIWPSVKRCAEGTEFGSSGCCSVLGSAWKTENIPR